MTESAPIPMLITAGGERVLELTDSKNQQLLSDLAEENRRLRAELLVELQVRDQELGLIGQLDGLRAEQAQLARTNRAQAARLAELEAKPGRLGALEIELELLREQSEAQQETEAELQATRQALAAAERAQLAAENKLRQQDAQLAGWRAEAQAAGGLERQLTAAEDRLAAAEAARADEAADRRQQAAELRRAEKARDVALERLNEAEERLFEAGEQTGKLARLEIEVASLRRGEADRRRAEHDQTAHVSKLAAELEAVSMVLDQNSKALAEKSLEVTEKTAVIEQMERQLAAARGTNPEVSSQLARFEEINRLSTARVLALEQELDRKEQMLQEAADRTRSQLHTARHARAARQMGIDGPVQSWLELPELHTRPVERMAEPEGWERVCSAMHQDAERASELRAVQDRLNVTSRALDEVNAKKAEQVHILSSELQRTKAELSNAQMGRQQAEAALEEHMQEDNEQLRELQRRLRNRPGVEDTKQDEEREALQAELARTRRQLKEAQEARGARQLGEAVSAMRRGGSGDGPLAVELEQIIDELETQHVEQVEADTALHVQQVEADLEHTRLELEQLRQARALGTEEHAGLTGRLEEEMQLVEALESEIDRLKQQLAERSPRRAVEDEEGKAAMRQLEDQLRQTRKELSTMQQIYRQQEDQVEENFSQLKDDLMQRLIVCSKVREKADACRAAVTNAYATSPLAVLPAVDEFVPAEAPTFVVDKGEHRVKAAQADAVQSEGALEEQLRDVAAQKAALREEQQALAREKAAWEAEEAHRKDLAAQEAALREEQLALARQKAELETEEAQHRVLAAQEVALKEQRAAAQEAALKQQEVAADEAALKEQQRAAAQEAAAQEAALKEQQQAAVQEAALKEEQQALLKRAAEEAQQRDLAAQTALLQQALARQRNVEEAHEESIDWDSSSSDVSDYCDDSNSTAPPEQQVLLQRARPVPEPEVSMNRKATLPYELAISERPPARRRVENVERTSPRRTTHGMRASSHKFGITSVSTRQ